MNHVQKEKLRLICELYFDPYSEHFTEDVVNDLHFADVITDKESKKLLQLLDKIGYKLWDTLKEEDLKTLKQNK